MDTSRLSKGDKVFQRVLDIVCDEFELNEEDILKYRRRNDERKASLGLIVYHLCQNGISYEQIRHFVKLKSKGNVSRYNNFIIKCLSNQNTRIPIEKLIIDKNYKIKQKLN